MTKDEILSQIAALEDKINETLTGLDRGPVKDAMRLVVPMMHDQLALLTAIVKEMS